VACGYRDWYFFSRYADVTISVFASHTWADPTWHELYRGRISFVDFIVIRYLSWLEERERKGGGLTSGRIFNL
jgi:hypothetical protein